MSKGKSEGEIGQQIQAIGRQRNTIDSELAELSAELAGDMGSDVQRAVERHSQLTAEIAGRESVRRNLTDQIDRLSEELEEAAKLARTEEAAALRSKIEDFLTAVEVQVAVALDLAREPEILRAINRLGVLEGGPLGNHSLYRGRLAKAIRSMDFVDAQRANERFSASMLDLAKRQNSESKEKYRESLVDSLRS